MGPVPGWTNIIDELAESAGDPFWRYADDNLSKSLSAGVS